MLDRKCSGVVRSVCQNPVHLSNLETLRIAPQITFRLKPSRSTAIPPSLGHKVYKNAAKFGQSLSNRCRAKILADSAGDIRVIQPVHPALCSNLAVIDKHKPVGNPAPFHGMMCHGKNGARTLGLQCLQQCHHLGAQAWPQRGERFVKQQDWPVLQQCPGKSSALAFSAGKFVRQAVFLAAQSNPRDCLVQLLSVLWR